MIDININNYEECFVDYFDGNLNSLEEEALMSFLNRNPQLKEGFHSFNDERISAEDIAFNNKEILKRDSLLLNSKESNFNELCIASIEGDLKGRQVIDFERMINSDISKKKELELFALTKILPDNSIVFKNKDKLKITTQKRTTITYTIISVAATVLILVGMYFLIPKSANELYNSEASELVSDNIININDDKNEIIEDVVEKNEIQNITETNTGRNNRVTKEKVKIEKEATTINRIKNDNILVAYLDPIEIRIKETGIKKLPILNIKYINNEPSVIIKKDEYISFRSFLAKSVNKKVFKKKKDKIEMFDIAQVGIKGINKLTGSNMTLERVFDENGNPDKTEFTSRLMAFSTPIKN